MSTIDVTAGETFSGTVNAGDTLVVEAGGQTSGATVYGTETLDGGLSSGDTIEAGGVLNNDAEGAVIYDVTIAGGSVDQGSSILLGGLTFSGPGGHLTVDTSSTVPITGFVSGDGILFPEEIVPAFGAELTVDGDAVTVTEPYGSSYDLDIVGASTDNLSIAVLIPPHPGGRIIVSQPELVCFLAGTSIATPGGDRMIETLAAGDLVVTSDGGAQCVRWLGRQTVSTRFADPLRVAPIRVRRDALGENLPVRDLLVSPDHALMVDGVFVQAGALVNGVSITREDADMPERFTYFHVELSDHSLIMAEGVAAETFIDNADRMNFDNWDEYAALGNETAPMSEMPHARAKSHRQVSQALRARLMARGVELYWTDVAAVA